ncbi:MAG: AEC family transporter [Orrella sp.]
MSVLLAAYLSTILRMLPLVVCGLIGFVWGKRGIAYPSAFVSTLVTYVAIPLLVFHTLMTTPLDADALLLILGVSTVSLLGAALLVAGLLWVFRLPVAALGQTAWMPNAGNLGLPMATLVFGAEGLTVAIAFFAVSSFLSFTLGLRWLTGSAGKVSRQPVVWATILAVLGRAVGLSAPEWLLESALLLGSLAVPLMLLTLGHALSALPRSGLKAGTLVAMTRFTSGGLVALILLTVSGLPHAIAAPIALQMVMPCAINSYLFARLHGTEGDASAGGVLVSTLAFILLAPLLLWALGAT